MKKVDETNKETQQPGAEINPIQTCFDIVRSTRVRSTDLVRSDPRAAGVARALEMDFQRIENLLIYKLGAVDPDALTKEERRQQFPAMKSFMGKEIKVQEKKKPKEVAAHSIFDRHMDPDHPERKAHVKKLLYPGIINTMAIRRLRPYAELYLKKCFGENADLTDWFAYGQVIINAHYRKRYPGEYVNLINDDLFKKIVDACPLAIEKLNKVTRALEQGLAEIHVEWVINNL